MGWNNSYTPSQVSHWSKMFVLVLASLLLHGIWHGLDAAESASHSTGSANITTHENASISTNDAVNQTQSLHDLKNSTLNETETPASVSGISESDDGGNKTQHVHDLKNTTSNDTAAVPGGFGFDDVAGIRSFSLDQQVDMRIVGGQEAWAFSWPWQVSLHFASMSACGGAIIAPLWVLSATHCFRIYRKASMWTVMAGKHDLDNPHEPGQQVVGVARIIVHQGYNKRTKVNDVALLRLQVPLVFNQYVRPIEIWMAPLEPSRKCSVTGWGSTRENGPRMNRLQEVNVTCLPFEVCNQFYRGRVRPTMFCAGRPDGGADACQGDSGGPVSCFTGSSYKLAGLVSWGVGCGRARKPGVYTKLQDYIDWIAMIMTNDMSIVYGDDGLMSEDDCGEAETAACRLSSVPAGLVASKKTGVQVEGVTEACPNSWPWQVSLQSEGKHYCSGTLIHKSWVLAPRHCQSKVKDDVLLGAHDLRVTLSQPISVDKVYSMPQDQSFPPSSDLSLLHLSEPARIGSIAYPICILDEDDDVELDDTWSCVTTGWGTSTATVGVSPHTLHQATVGLVNQTVCRHSWGEDLITDNHLCADPAASVSCMEDSGAPLFCRKHGVYYLFGIVTWGSNHCGAEKPAVFSSITAYHPWITKITDEV